MVNYCNDLVFNCVLFFNYNFSILYSLFYSGLKSQVAAAIATAIHHCHSLVRFYASFFVSFILPQTPYVRLYIWIYLTNFHCLYIFLSMYTYFCWVVSYYYIIGLLCKLALISNRSAAMLWPAFRRALTGLATWITISPPPSAPRFRLSVPCSIPTVWTGSPFQSPHTHLYKYLILRRN